MSRVAIIKLVGVFVCVVLVASFSLEHVLAGTLGFGGDAGIDNFWNVTLNYCTNGFTVKAQQTLAGDGLAYSINVGASTLPIQASLPARVAGGIGTGLVSGSIAVFFTSSHPVGTPISVTILRFDHGDASATDDTADLSNFDDVLVDAGVVGNCSVPVGSFSPGDNRIDGHAGDRLIAYCNLGNSTLDLWGVALDSSGFRLALFNYADIVKAGPKGLFKNTGQNGVISVAVDNQNNFYAAWNGGRFNATGLGIFAKSFKCPFAPVGSNVLPTPTLSPGQHINPPEPGAPPNNSKSPIASGTTYTVQKGDTLYSIARKFQVSVQALVSANGIINPNLLRVGEVLQIP